MSRRFVRRLLPLTFLGAAALVLAGAGCGQLLHLDDFYDCPEDPRCASCTDGKKNNDETDVDCGGSCPNACANGKACKVAADCASGTCTTGTCAGPSCTDQKKNGTETDVDCGGDCPNPCAVGKKCNGDGDCTSGVCMGGTCAPAATCTDMQKNGGETDVDCGGPMCGKCPDGKGCTNGGDCASASCKSGTCAKASCADQIQNQDETDTDCGGATCPKCAYGQGCMTDGDCLGGSCGADMKCAATCTDGVKDGDETDKDCGGATCPKCTNGGGCAVGGDCASGVCQGGACVDYYEWAKRFGDSNSQQGSAVAVDNLSNIYLASQVKGTVNFGGNTLTSATNWGVTLAKFDASGTHVWSKMLPSGFQNHVTSMAVDFNDRVIITGQAASGADFGGGPLSGTGFLNFFIAKYDTGGNHLWSKLLPGGIGQAVTTSSVGDILVAGYTGPACDFGCGSLAASGGSDIVVAKISGVFNTCMWSKRFGNAATMANDVQGMAVDSAGNTIIASRFQGTLDFGCGALVSATAGIGSIAIAKLNTSGQCVWSKAFGDPNNGMTSEPEVVGLGVDSSANVFVGGYFRGSFDPGTGVVTANGTYDVFAWRLDASGSTSWFKHYGVAPNGYEEPIGFATNAAGKVLITGAVDAGVDFGGGPLPGGAFVTELDSAGNHLWSRSFGPGMAYGRSVAFSGTSDVVLTGWLLGQLDFGGGPLTTMGADDIFLAKLLLP